MEELGRAFSFAQPYSGISFPASGSTGGRGGAEKVLWRRTRQKKQQARLPMTRDSPLSNLPGSCMPMPRALQNTIWNPLHSSTCLPGGCGGGEDGFPLKPIAQNLQMGLCAQNHCSEAGQDLRLGEASSGIQCSVMFSLPRSKLR